MLKLFRFCLDKYSQSFKNLKKTVSPIHSQSFKNLKKTVSPIHSAWQLKADWSFDGTADFCFNSEFIFRFLFDIITISLLSPHCGSLDGDCAFGSTESLCVCTLCEMTLILITDSLDGSGWFPSIVFIRLSFSFSSISLCRFLIASAYVIFVPELNGISVTSLAISNTHPWYEVA